MNRQRERGGLDVAVVGATGAVGEVLLDVLDERGFPLRNLRPLASARSAGERVRFRGRRVEVAEATPDAFDDVDVVFFAATGPLSKTLAPEAAARGAVVIDKSSTWRMEPDVPLVVPEINPEALDDHRGIVSCPNCTTIGLVMSLEPLRRVAGLKSVVVTTFQAVSGAGRDAMDELTAQRRALLDLSWPRSVHLPRPIVNNVIPLCESAGPDGFTGEERKLLDESRKIFGLPDLAVSMTCVRVPVMVGHGASVLVETERPLSPVEAREAIGQMDGVRYVDSEVGPTPIDVAGNDEVLVGRLRSDFDPRRLWLWEVSDNLRKGAATNAVQIAETLVKRALLSKERAALPGQSRSMTPPSLISAGGFG